MHKHSLFCRAAALVLTLALTAALALPGFAAAYAMPIQTAYDAEAVYLFDASTGEALVEQNPDQVRPIASLTKMMTALLVLESGADLNESIPIPDSLTPEHPPQELAGLWRCGERTAAARLEYAVKTLPRAAKLALLDVPEQVGQVFPALAQYDYAPVRGETLAHLLEEGSNG